jgi:hypothetical protein
MKNLTLSPRNPGLFPNPSRDRREKGLSRKAENSTSREKEVSKTGGRQARPFDAGAVRMRKALFMQRGKFFHPSPGRKIFPELGRSLAHCPPVFLVIQ